MKDTQSLVAKEYEVKEKIKPSVIGGQLEEMVHLAGSGNLRGRIGEPGLVGYTYSSQDKGVSAFVYDSVDALKDLFHLRPGNPQRYLKEKQLMAYSVRHSFEITLLEERYGSDILRVRHARAEGKDPYRRERPQEQAFDTYGVFVKNKRSGLWGLQDQSLYVRRLPVLKEAMDHIGPAMVHYMVDIHAPQPAVLQRPALAV